MSKPPYVPTRRAGRNAELVIVFEQRSGLWSIIEVHRTGTPRRNVYTNQSEQAARNCSERAVREGQKLIVWGSRWTPTAAFADVELPLFALEVER